MKDLEKMGAKSQADAVAVIARISKLVGQARATAAVRQFATMAEIAALKEIVETKGYRFLTRAVLVSLFPDREPGTLPERCETADDLWDVLGTSRQRVHELVRGYEQLGEDFMQRAAELDLGRRTLSLALSLNGESRKHALALASKSSTDRKTLVSEIRILARECGAREAEQKHLSEEVGKQEKQIEKGKTQLKDAKAKARGLQEQLREHREGRALPDDEKAAVEEFQVRCREARAFFIKCRNHRWQDAGIEDPLAMSWAALMCDEAQQLFEELQGDHGIARPTGRMQAMIEELARPAREAAEATPGEETAG